MKKPALCSSFTVNLYITGCDSQQWFYTVGWLFFLNVSLSFVVSLFIQFGMMSLVVVGIQFKWIKLAIDFKIERFQSIHSVNLCWQFSCNICKLTSKKKIPENAICIWWYQCVVKHNSYIEKNCSNKFDWHINLSWKSIW